MQSIALINAENNELLPINTADSIHVFPEIEAKGFVVELKTNSYDILNLENIDVNSESSYAALEQSSTELLLDTIYNTFVARIGG